MRSLNQLSIANYFGRVEPNLTKREQWVMEAVEELAPCTAAMVAEHYGVGEHIISGRFTGLKKKRAIFLDYEGVNQFGNKVGYYSPTQLPEMEYTDAD
jgi:hypothetical protein